MKKTILTLTVSAIALFAATASAPAAGADVDHQITEIQQRYQPQFDELQEEGRRINDDAPHPTGLEAGIGVDFDVTWDRTSIKFDVPEIKMKRQEIKLHLPQVSMKTTSIKWDNPEFFSGMTKVGEYPCFRGLKWYSCDIKTKVPQVRMVRREAKFDVPQFTWAMTTIKLDIPEFFSKRIEIKLDLPQFKAKDVKAEIGKQKTAANALERKAEDLAGQQAREIQAVVSADLAQKRGDIERQFDDAIAKLSAAIDKVKAAGVNPEAVQSEGQTQNLVAMLAKLKQQRAQTLEEFTSKSRVTSSGG
ncbi:hypothetical protein NKH84_24030 [Mesorhizobium sp. M0902]|uniref:hypothetical protein n=1 Tax=unclassified Mesorhizobium TaxID=325217 RepID=UPI0033356816